MVQPSVEDLSRPNTGYNPSSRAQLSSAVAVPTKGDSYAFRGEQATYCVPVVSALYAAVGERWTLRDASPRSSGSTLERAEEFAEAPREERE